MAPGPRGHYETRALVAHVLMLAAAALVLYVPLLGTGHVLSTEQARYAVAARDLLARGGWLSAFHDAPASISALYLWLVAAAGIPGGLTELAARLPSAVAGIGGVLATYFLGRQLFGAGAGFVSGLVLATSAGYFSRTRTIGPDLAFAFFIVLALLGFDLWRRQRGWRAALLLVSSAATAIMVRGPQGLLLGYHELGPLTERPLAGVLSVPDSLFFYGKTLLIGLLPWTVLLPSALVMGVRDLRRRGAGSPIVLPLFWIMILFALVGLQSVHRTGDLAPLYPAAALLIGGVWTLTTSAALPRGGRLALEIPAGILGAGAVILGLALATGPGIPVPGPAAPFFSGTSRGALLLGLAAAATGAFSLFDLLRGRSGRALLLLALLVIPTTRVVEAASLSNEGQDLQALVSVVRGFLETSQPIAVVDGEEPLLEFYVGRKLPVLSRAAVLEDHQHSRSMYLLGRENALSRLQDGVPRPLEVLAKATLEQSPLLLVSQAPLATGICEVVLVSVDGLRPDAIGRFQTPVLSRLIREGASAPRAETVEISTTLPGHVAMLAGVGPTKSGMYRDSWTSAEPRIRRPTVFEVVHQAGFNTAMFTGKAKFGYLATPGTIDYLEAAKKGDAEVMAAALRYLASPQPGFTFIHLPDNDRFGHHHGWMSPQQQEVIEQVDKLIGRLAEQLTASPGREASLLIITADHGGEGRTHYRQWSLWPSWRATFNRIPWIAWGGAVKPGFEVPDRAWVYDTAATVAYALGVGSALDWDGRPLTEIFVAPPWTLARGPAEARSPRRCPPG